MKKYSLVFLACVFNGSFADADNAANACSPGSGTIFTETQSEALGAHLAFTDANGDAATIVPGDAFQPVYNDDNSFKGYVAVDASVVKTWVEVTEAAADATGADAAASTDGAAATS